MDNLIPVLIDYTTANDDMIRFNNCRFFSTNNNLFIKHDIPSDNYGRKQWIVNSDGCRKTGKLIYRGGNLEIKIHKNMFKNGMNLNIFIDAHSDISYSWEDTMINDSAGIKVVGTTSSPYSSSSFSVSEAFSRFPLLTRPLS